MSTIPPPPPPLPVPSLNPVKVEQNGVKARILATDICKWAIHSTPLREVCATNLICAEKPPYRYQYKNVESIIQIGPTCGLVALAMLLNGEVSPDELLSISKLKGFSGNGEMLSCKNMAILAEKAISLVEENVTCWVREGGLYNHEIIQELLDGAFLMVPYDADRNHDPCKKHGHTAHWALVCGVIIVADPGEDDYTALSNNVYVLCRHGKTRFLNAWPLEDLAKSNKNLWEFSPKKQEDDLLYVIPEGGIGGENGLRNQYLIFKSF